MKKAVIIDNSLSKNGLESSDKYNILVFVRSGVGFGLVGVISSTWVGILYWSGGS